MDKVTLQTKLGTAVRERRQALEYSQDTFADAIGMHRAYYSAIERGERNVTLATLAKVAEGLDMPIAALMAQAKL
ncbi:MULTISPECIES: helix-turn-helix domain-containing protein [Rhodanobacter]|uniref:Putative transcriptional regulator n=1 Tax=Rhodanobacter denitrificans TaxID=666685 RepID=I4WGY8_9GAMM|nr:MULTISPECIES: helix-turn-helix transcriptional regulator [Rhodanobacter]AGG90927.1 putative transcriptional regulator [Rhodanobacter denitrificans]EIL98729.1 putative DNA-binding protein [Rhodanobacter denitrificans]KZC21548.1 transcriptional regulator [Rhodanobacter denitrificans]UJM86296.1 helix-turn-helix transcriptional regulator [Rhodanobacter denitrificans]UJM90235.1 helix-turn-helix transcriptional regulator [Rhodanobacter denitrificans]